MVVPAGTAEAAGSADAGVVEDGGMTRTPRTGARCKRLPRGGAPVREARRHPLANTGVPRRTGNQSRMEAARCPVRHASGDVPVQRLNALWNALGSE